MNKEPILVILPDTPESLVQGMDQYTRELLATPWWDFARRRLYKQFIINAHKKRIALLDEEKR